MSRKSKEQYHRCFIHCDQYESQKRADICQGNLVTRKSVFGAVVRACKKAWESSHVVGESNVPLKINLEKWPEILKVEEL